MQQTRSKTTLLLVEGAIMIALGTVLSMIKFDLPLGGGVTLCSMLPLVFYSYRNGVKWGFFTAVAYSIIQMLLGLDNVQYAQSVGMALAIVLLDYIVAYSVLGFAGLLRDKLSNPRLAIALGTASTIFLRFLCHFVTGIYIWEVLWPNEFGYAPVAWSFIYNGSYMGVELVITTVAALLLVRYADIGKRSA